MGLSYGSDIQFALKSDAFEVYDKLLDLCKAVGYATEEDFFVAAGLIYDKLDDEECSIGWSLKDILETSIVPISLNHGSAWFINLPFPKDIADLMAKNINNTRRTNKMVNYNAMPTTTKTLTHLYNYEDSPEDVEFEKKRKELTDEAEKKILDIRIELSKKLEALRAEYQEKEAVKREERQAHAWRRRYNALCKEGFSVEQAWEMTMEAFKVD